MRSWHCWPAERHNLSSGGRLKFSILGIFLQIEWRICHDVVEFEVFMLVVGEGRYRFVSQW